MNRENIISIAALTVVVVSLYVFIEGVDELQN